MKKTMLSIAVLMLLAQPAQALMLMGYEQDTFQDVANNRTWLKINYGYFQNYTQIEESLIGSGFSFADEKDMQELMSSFYPTGDNWYPIASMMGSDTSGSTMARFRNGGYAGFGGFSDNYQDGWQYYSSGAIPEDVSDQAIGAWIRQDKQMPLGTVPEPATICLFGMGAAAIAWKKRKLL